MSAQVKIFRICLLGSLLATASLHAADKIELRGSTAVELPKPSRNIEEPRRFKFDTSNGLEGGGLLPPSDNRGDAALDRKLREMLDKRKNWIFENPYEKKYDDRTADILEKDPKSAGNLLEHRLLQDDEKTAMQRFVEEKDTRRRREDNTASDSGDRRSNEKREFASSLFRDSDEDNQREEKPIAIIFGTENSIFKERDRAGEAANFERKMDRGPVENSTFAESRFADGQRGARDGVLDPQQKQIQENREADFNKLLQSRSAIGIASPTAESRLESAFNPSIGGGRPELGAAAINRRYDPLAGGARGDLGAARGGGLSGVPNMMNSLPGRSPAEIGDINARISKGPSFLPENSPLTVAPSSPAFSPSPFVLEMPRRKF